MKMDNVKLIIEIEILQDKQITMYLYDNTLIILDSNPCMFHAIVGNSTDEPFKYASKERPRITGNNLSSASLV